MPSNQNWGNHRFRRYDHMSDEALQAILREDSQKAEPGESDPEMLLYVTEVLALRHRNDINRKPVEEAFEEFKAHYMPDDSSGSEEMPEARPVARFAVRLRKWNVAAAVLALLVLGSVTANALGNNLVETVVAWTQETFHFGDRGNTDSPPTPNDDREFASLQEALTVKGISTALVPTWIPGGYTLWGIQIEESPAYTKYLAVYSDGDTTLKIQVKQYHRSIVNDIEQSGELLDIYYSDGVEYYLFRNLDQLVIAWKTEEFECYFAGELTVEEAIKMIDSI